MAHGPGNGSGGASRDDQRGDDNQKEARARRAKRRAKVLEAAVIAGESSTKEASTPAPSGPTSSSVIAARDLKGGSALKKKAKRGPRAAQVLLGADDKLG